MRKRSNQHTEVMRVLKKVPGLDAFMFKEKHNIRNLAQLKAIAKPPFIDPEQWYYIDAAKSPSYAEVKQYVAIIEAALRSLSKDATLHVVGSYRRKAKHLGDIDILISGNNGSVLMDLMRVLMMDGLVVKLFGDKKHTVTALCQFPGKKAMNAIDFVYASPESFPFALLNNTGPIGFNTALKGIAGARDLNLTNHGLFDKRTHKRVDFVFPDERSIFKFLGVKFLKPEDRKPEMIRVEK